MLVYLDTAQLADLDRAVTKRELIADEFFSVWKEKGCILALSRTHAQEMAPLRDESFGSRLGVLSKFPQIAFADSNHDWVSELEIRAQTVSRLYPEMEENPYAMIREELFPLCTPAAFWDFAINLRPHVLALQAEYHRQAAFENDELDLMKKLEKLVGKRPKLPAITEVDPRLLEEIERVQMRWIPRLAAEPFHQRTRERLHAHLGEKLSRRQAQVRIHGLENVPAAKRAPDEDLSMVAWLRDLGDRLVFKWCVLEGFPADRVRAALDQFDLYLAPGISIGRAAYRGWRKSNNKRKPSDHADGEHLLSAAHTDLAFVDQRTETFISQGRKQAPELLSPHLHTTFRRSSNLGTVITAIREWTPPG